MSTCSGCGFTSLRWSFWHRSGRHSDFMHKITSLLLSFGRLLQFQLKMCEDGLFLGCFQQHRPLFSYKVQDLLRFQGGEVPSEDGFDTALQDVVQFLSLVLQQGFLSVPDGDVDEKEEVLDGGLVELGEVQKCVPEEEEDGSVFFSWDSQEHQLYKGFAEGQTVEGLELPDEALVWDQRMGQLFVLQPIQSTPYTQQQLLKETSTQLQPFIRHKLDHLLNMRQPLHYSSASEIPNPHLLDALLQLHQHLLRPFLAFSAHQDTLGHLCGERRVQEMQFYEVVLLQGLEEGLVELLEVVWDFDIFNEGGKFSVDPSQDIPAVLRPFLDRMKQVLTPQHSLGQSKAQIVPTHHFWPGLFHGLIEISYENCQIAGLQSGHGLRIVGTVLMIGSEQMRQSRCVNE